MSRFPGALALAALGLWPAPSPATSARFAPLESLASAADLVVVGRAVSRASYRTEEGRILTRVTVETEEVWRGSPARSVEVVTLGGIVGDVGQVVHGAASIARGERVALFLARDPRHGFVPLGLWQGVFHVDGDGPEAPVRRPLPPVRIVGGPEPLLPQTLAALRRTVLEAPPAAR